MGDHELAVLYVDKFWDAGNAIVFSIFGLVFAVVATFAASLEVRILAIKYMLILRRLARIGNLFLLFWLLVFGAGQIYFTPRVDQQHWPEFIAYASVFVRIVFFIASYILYIRILWRVETLTVLNPAQIADIQTKRNTFPTPSSWSAFLFSL
ncbi:MULTISPECIES: hypothetical protein [unclassified Rhizobium]|uniref:hypothetical protein n=1 Tax=unclassified Rhizobium TaxID=2613769 RepID=UPI00115DCBE9|nr:MULTISPECIES: hypothetical protein [unclassified Rhizobium]TQX88453.1 hypothetical protein EQW76_11500 [Rhizobium sp. rho-13.1]TQY12648.1 hypothetical protein EQW74_15145 [Rhizobium sp. rho-1.1]